MCASNVLYNDNKTSVKSIFFRFKWRISLTMLLVVIESLLDILFPLFIGWAINDLLQNKMDGIYLLILLGGATLIIGSARRFYDTRIYAGIYRIIAPEMVMKEKNKNKSVSVISGRANLLTEFVEFFENSVPDIISAIIGLLGILLIISTINSSVFLACLALLAVVFFIYLLTGQLNYQFNAQYNETFEQQVNAISHHDTKMVQSHFKRLMHWNIKLSDLETTNYFFIWCAVIALLVYAPINSINSGVINYGMIFSLLMYIFDYIDKVVSFPYFIQQIIRLKEISTRLQS